MSRLTVGYRCRVKPKDEWSSYGYANHECIIQARSGNHDFFVIMLKEGKNVPLKKESDTVTDVSGLLCKPDELVLVDRKVTKNMEFVDWYEEASEFECLDCGHLCYSKGNHTMVLKGYDMCCPKCGYAMG